MLLFPDLTTSKLYNRTFQLCPIAAQYFSNTRILSFRIWCWTTHGLAPHCFCYSTIATICYNTLTCGIGPLPQQHHRFLLLAIEIPPCRSMIFHKPRLLQTQLFILFHLNLIGSLFESKRFVLSVTLWIWCHCWVYHWVLLFTSRFKLKNNTLWSQLDNWDRNWDFVALFPHWGHDWQGLFATYQMSFFYSHSILAPPPYNFFSRSNNL